MIIEDHDDYEICFFRPGEIDVHIKVSSKAVTFKPGSVCICELEADDCGEFDLLIETMKELGKRPSRLRDVLMWFRIPEFIVLPEVLFIDQDLDEVTIGAFKKQYLEHLNFF